MAWWIWIVVGIVLLAAEVVISTDFYLVFLGLAAFVVGILDLVGLSIPGWGEWLLFAALAIAGVVAYRSHWRRRLLTADREMAPELVGETGTARVPIPAGGRGRIELRGAVWEALNADAGEIGAGDRCRVERVDGLTLVVRPER